MKRLFLTTLTALALTACATGPDRHGRFLPPKANPSAVISAELGFARLAQEKGQWTAFRQTAAKDAEMFVPQRVLAQDWLRGRADPPVSVKWQPTAVWSSCDGSYAVTRGNWQSANASGGFVTVWQRQGDPKRAPRQGEKTEYKWVLDMSETTEHSPVASDAIEAKVAACAPPYQPTGIQSVEIPSLNPPRDYEQKSGQSADNTLQWSTVVFRDGRRRITASVWNGSSFEWVIELDGSAD